MLEKNNLDSIVSEEVFKLLTELGKLQNPQKVIDLTCEYQSLFSSFDNKAKVTTGIKKNKKDAEIIEESESPISIKRGKQIKRDIVGKYDLVYFTLPFNEKLKKDRRNNHKNISLFLETGLSLLDENGSLHFLCHSAFLFGNIYKEIRSFIMKNYNLKAIVTIPAANRRAPALELALLVIENSQSNYLDEVLMPKYSNNRNEIIECFRNKSCELMVPKYKMKKRWDRHFLDPKYNKIDDILQGKETYELGE